MLMVCFCFCNLLLCCECHDFKYFYYGWLNRMLNHMGLTGGTFFLDGEKRTAKIVSDSLSTTIDFLSCNNKRIISFIYNLSMRGRICCVIQQKVFHFYVN